MSWKRVSRSRLQPSEGGSGTTSRRLSGMTGERNRMSQIPTHTVTLLHLHEDDHGDTHFGTRDIELALREFAPPATPFDVSDAQPASQFAMIRLPVGWVGESHTSPRPQVLFCLSGRLKITCSS